MRTNETDASAALAQCARDAALLRKAPHLLFPHAPKGEHNICTHIGMASRLRVVSCSDHAPMLRSGGFVEASHTCSMAIVTHLRGSGHGQTPGSSFDPSEGQGPQKLELPALAASSYLGIVPCGHLVSAQALAVVQQSPKLDVAVAGQVRIGSNTRLTLQSQSTHHQLLHRCTSLANPGAWQSMKCDAQGPPCTFGHGIVPGQGSLRRLVSSTDAQS